MEGRDQLAGEPMTGDVQGAFRALADPTRRQILAHLSTGDMTIGEMVARFDMTRAAVRKHMHILEQGALISLHTKGRERISRLEPQGLKSVSEWISAFSIFWDNRLAGLKAAVEREEGNNNAS